MIPPQTRPQHKANCASILLGLYSGAASPKKKVESAGSFERRLHPKHDPQLPGVGVPPGKSASGSRNIGSTD